MKTRIIILASILACMGCSKSIPTPTSNLTAGHGSWSYSGNTYTSTTATWVSNTLVSSADKPHSSTVEAAFSSASPGSGDYTIPSNYQITTGNQTIISIVDSTLPAITYSSIDANSGTVSVSRSGSSTTVTVTNLKLKGFTPKLVLDSIVVTGTFTKQ